MIRSAAFADTLGLKPSEQQRDQARDGHVDDGEKEQGFVDDEGVLADTGGYGVDVDDGDRRDQGRGLQLQDGLAAEGGQDVADGLGEPRCGGRW